MKNTKTILKGLGLALLGFGYQVHAAYALNKEATQQAVSGNIATDEDIMGIVSKVMTWIFGVAFAFVVAMIIVGGFRYITSAGNEGQAEQAKENITKAIIGLVIILLAYVIAATINNIILGRGTGGVAPARP